MKRILKIVGIVAASIILLFVAIAVFLQSPIGKKWLTKQVSTFASDYLHTEVKGTINYKIPDWVVLENFLIKDQSGDTLVAGKKLHIDLDMWELVRNNRLLIDNVILDRAVVSIRRKTGDSTFNYAFLLNALASDTPADTTTPPLSIRLNKIILRDSHLKFDDAKTSQTFSAKIAEMTTGFEQLDLNDDIYRLKDIRLNGIDIAAKFGVTTSPVQNTKSSENKQLLPLVELQKLIVENASWDVSAAHSFHSKGQLKAISTQFNEIDLNKNIFVLGNTTLNATWLSYQTPQRNYSKPKKGIDFTDLAVQHFTFEADSMRYTSQQALLALRHLSFSEKSGFVIKKVKGDVNYKPNSLAISNFLLETPYSKLGNNLLISHPSLATITENLEKTAIKLQLKDSYVGSKDVLFLQPDLVENVFFKKANSDKLWITTQLEGTLNNLLIRQIELKGLYESKLVASGVVKGLPSPKSLSYSIHIDEISTTKKAYLPFLPDSLTQAYGLPDFVRLSGQLNGYLSSITTQLLATTSLGNAQLNGHFEEITSSSPTYNGTIALNEFDLATLLKDERFKQISLTSSFSGKGIDPKTMETSLEGTLKNAHYDGYDYSNIQFKTLIKNQQADFAILSADAHLNGSIEGNINFSTTYPTLESKGSFRQLDMHKLGFSANPLALKGDFSIRFSDSNPASPIGKIELTNASFDTGNEIQDVGDLSLQLASSLGMKEVQVNSSFVQAKLTGSFEYTQLSDLLITEANNYFKLNSLSYKPTTSPANFKLTGSLHYHPVIHYFIPEITAFQPITFDTDFDNTKSQSVVTQLRIPSIEYDSIRIQNTQFLLSTNGEKATYSTTLENLQLADFQLRKASLTGEIANDVASFNFIVKDSLNRTIHGLAGNLASFNKVIRVSLAEKGFLLYYNQWNSEGTLELHPKGIIADAIRLSYNGQQLAIKSKEYEPNAPIELQANRIELNELGKAFLQDSTLLGGLLNANIEVRNLAESPAYTGDFIIQNLAITQIPVGELALNASNKGKEAISITGSLTSEVNDIRLSGDYQLGRKNPLDLALDLRKVSAKTLEAFSLGELQQTKGGLHGYLTIKGSPEKPLIQGDLESDNLFFTITQLGSGFGTTNQKISFKGQHAELTHFILTDSLEQELAISGRFSFADFANLSYRFDAIAENFTAIDAPKGANEYFFGTAVADATIRVQGVNERFKIDGDIQLKKGTALSLLLPDEANAGNEMQQLIQFVDKDKPIISIKNKKQKEPSSIRYEASVAIKADENSELTLVMDDLTGDNIRVKGKANLQAGINTNDELFMYGDYIITEGKYDFTFELLKKSFAVRQGSSIRWTGDPLNAEVNIIAQDAERTLSLYDYVSSDKDFVRLPDSKKEILKQNNLPVILLIKLKNTLSEMQPSFEVATYENAANFLDLSNKELKGLNVTLITDEGKIDSPEYSAENENHVNKQAFSLIVLGRFLPENLSQLLGPLAGNESNVEQFARKNASKILSEQLDRFTSGLIKGVDLNVGLASDADTKSTAVNLGVKKGFLDNRITVSVGRNFELENTQMQSNEIFDNIEAAYRITKDGRYRIKAYRRNQYKSVVEGFVVETGVGFVITIEYDQLTLKKNK